MMVALFKKTSNQLIIAGFIVSLLFPTAGAFGGIIKFEDAFPSGGPAVPGTVTYNGIDGVGSLIGTDIPVDLITGTGGPSLDCVGCLLNFSTGANISEGPPIWIFGGLGTLSIEGAVPDLGLPGGTTLVSGTFGTDANVAVGVGTTLSVTATGVDTKDAELITHFNEPGPFEFLFSTLQLGTAVINNTTGAFTATVTDVDFANTTVPIPNAMLLMGTGLIGLLLFRRVK